MTFKNARIFVLTVAATILFLPSAQAQIRIQQTDVAITYSLERAKIEPINCGCFWLNGASADGAATLFKGLGIAANLTGEQASNITPGVNLSKISFVAGPRYTYNASPYLGGVGKKHHTQAFGEALFGVAHGFNSVFPAANGTTSSASSFALQLGIGCDIELYKGFAARIPELDYVRTALPNNGSNSQNDFRLAFGISYRFAQH